MTEIDVSHDYFETKVRDLQRRWGRELTPREKFYLAFAQSCADYSTRAKQRNGQATIRLRAR